MIKIHPEDLICMNAMAQQTPFRVDLAYAKADNLLFGERIYTANAQLYLHKDLARIVIKAAKKCYENHGVIFVLYDGLRTTDAQSKMMQTQRVLQNPHWLEEPRLLSPAGAGGHPRAMAIDIGLMDENKCLLDMGTPFDFLAANPHPDHNPAHRAYKGHSAEIMKNREILDSCMMSAAQELDLPLTPLAEEWWDFRAPASVYNQYAALSDADLPAHMRLTDI